MIMPLPEPVVRWCTETLGACVPLSDHSKEHGGHESGTWRVRFATGTGYLKVHTDVAHWENEVHAYERWAVAFGERAPRLLAVRAVPPLALIVSELPGRVLEHASLPPERERAVWRAAGAALVPLHTLETGSGFGPCHRDGAPVGDSGPDAVDHVSRRFGEAIERAERGAYIDGEEVAVVQAAHALSSTFAGEAPVPCHRDYCAANLLVDARGAWVGVVDFEFAHWDVRVVDFARDPDWAWIVRPDLFEAFVEGYGRGFSAVEEAQLTLARAEYALGAILWGRDHAFYGFEREGHEALAHLARRCR